MNLLNLLFDTNIELIKIKCKAFKLKAFYKKAISNTS